MKFYLILAFCLQALTATKAITRYGTNNLIELYEGNTNILITVPHDGGLSPTGMSERTNDVSDNLKRDLRTLTIAQTLRDTLTGRLGVTPFLLVNKIHRKFMDPNRPRLQCCYNLSEPSAVSYDEYHAFIQQYLNYVTNGNTIVIRGTTVTVRFNQSLILDVHGQAHSHNLTELGYDLTKTQLTNGKFYKENSTICSMASRSMYRFESILRGSVSLGKFIGDAVGIGCIPSPTNLTSNSDYYDGGYTVVTYGSKNCVGNSNGIQMELSATFRAGDAGLTTRSQKLGNATAAFYNTHNLGAIYIITADLLP